MKLLVWHLPGVPGLFCLPCSIILFRSQNSKIPNLQIYFANEIVQYNTVSSAKQQNLYTHSVLPMHNYSHNNPTWNSNSRKIMPHYSSILPDTEGFPKGSFPYIFIHVLSFQGSRYCELILTFGHYDGCHTQLHPF